jgi:hypothetical protein
MVFGGRSCPSVLPPLACETLGRDLAVHDALEHGPTGSMARLWIVSLGRLIVSNRNYVEMYGLSANVVKPGISLQGLLGTRASSVPFCRGRRD